ncbi:C4-dicarboxylate TRAP transporter substrate-binding protein (plasmid) [Leisingera sp. M527]|uniref:C4-dicarboxylate TRAP transporter substrate-binding protein n=1 Tax=Leisingera sp. M527 TaxID=2867014 RepID=UPI0021A3E225|nr:C4-dicarboxylate TRAP transporter substrate-binding protein [Leisingera sp. M527]UWQ35447.1 C4-dicarboxylate TRAP transporter substrate-binding protein [Leisingera sp. M527]
MKQFKTRSLLASAVAGLSILAGGSASAETISLSLAAGQSNRLIPVKLMQEFFAPEVDKRIEEAGLDIQIEWTHAYAGALCAPAKCIFAVDDGIVDIAYIPTLFHPDKLPLDQVSFMTPFLTNDIQTVVDTVSELHESIPEMSAQWDKYNQVRLTGLGIDTYQLLSTTPVESIDDAQGRKFGTAGAALSWMRGTGAVPVQSNMMDYYNNTKSGVYEGFIVFPSAYIPFKYTEVAPYVNELDFGAQSSSALTINKDVFEGLPEELQVILKEVADEYGRKSNAATQEWSTKSLTILGGNEDVTIVSISPEEKARWAEAMPNIAKEWAEQAESQGYPGNEVLTAFMDAIRAKGIEPVRNWDQE